MTSFSPRADALRVPTGHVPEKYTPITRLTRSDVNQRNRSQIVIGSQKHRELSRTAVFCKQAVRRHQNRFPDDFMFVLNPTEFNKWRSQFVTSNADRKGLRYAPMAFTEHGILMLSSVLNSKPQSAPTFTSHARS